MVDGGKEPHVGIAVSARAHRPAILAVVVALFIAALTLVPIAAGATETNGQITGTVRSGAAAVPDVQVDLFVHNGTEHLGNTGGALRGQFLRSAYTNADGRFSFTAAQGCYVMTFVAPSGRLFTNDSQWFNLPVCVTAGGRVTGANAALAAPAETEPAPPANGSNPQQPEPLPQQVEPDTATPADAPVTEAPPPAVKTAGATSSCLTAAGHVNPDPGECVGKIGDDALQDYAPSMSPEQVHVVSEDGAVIENTRIVGCLSIQASNVTVRNSTIDCFGSRDSGAGYRGAVQIGTGAVGTTIVNNTIQCQQVDPSVVPCDTGVIIGGSDTTVKRNEITGPVDGFDPQASNVMIVENYVHTLSAAYEEWRQSAYPNERTHYSHSDSMQVWSPNAANITFRGNYVMGQESQTPEERFVGTTALVAQAPSTTDGAPDIVIVSNAFLGTYVNAGVLCIAGAACTIEGNIFSDTMKDSPAINIGGSAPSTLVSCNRFEDGTVLDTANVYGGSATNDDC